MRHPNPVGPMVLGLAVLALAGCASDGHDHGSAAAGSPGGPGGPGGPMAMSTVSPTQGHTASGSVMFHEMGGYLMVHARLSGLKPGAEHGFHLHDKGDCASADGSSAGGHFNPTGQPHGPQDAAHHAGDMPALKADAAGTVNQHFRLDGPLLSAGPASIVGRSVIVHANPDDYATQPAGNSGPRIGCGVIVAR